MATANVQILGHWEDSDGTPAEGTVYFQRHDTIQEHGNSIVFGQVIRTRLDALGDLNTQVLGADPDDPNPLTRFYRVTERIKDNRAAVTYDIELDALTGVVDLTTVDRVSAIPDPLYLYATSAALTSESQARAAADVALWAALDEIGEATGFNPAITDDTLGIIDPDTAEDAAAAYLVQFGVPAETIPVILSSIMPLVLAALDGSQPTNVHRAITNLAEVAGLLVAGLAGQRVQLEAVGSAVEDEVTARANADNAQADLIAAEVTARAEADAALAEAIAGAIPEPPPIIDVPSDGSVTVIDPAPANGEELVRVLCGNGSRGFIDLGSPAGVNDGRRLRIRADVVPTGAGAARMGPSAGWQEWTPAIAGDFGASMDVDPSPPVAYHPVLTYDGIDYPATVVVADLGVDFSGYYPAMLALAALVPDGAVTVVTEGGLILQTTDTSVEHTLTVSFPDGWIAEPTPILAAAAESVPTWVGPNRDVKGLGDFTSMGYEHLWPDSPATDAGQQSGLMQSDGRTWLWTADSKRSGDISFIPVNHDWVSPGVPDKLSSVLNDVLERAAEPSPWDTDLDGRLGTVEDALPAKASLVDGKVPEAELPGYVDDVIEVADFAALSGVLAVTGKIYVTVDTAKAYRWTGSVFTELFGGLVLGETSATAYRGDRGKTAYDHSQATGNPHGATTADVADSANKRYVTDAQRTVLTNTSGTNTGDSATPPETTSTIGTLTAAATAKTTPVGADIIPLSDSTAGGIIRALTWTALLSRLDLRFDALGAATGLGADRAYIWDGTHYVVAGRRTFVGPNDPATDGFTLAYGDSWEQP